MVISGAGTGIGRALATTFASRRYQVIALGRTGKTLRSLQKEIERNGGTCLVMLCDVRRDRDVQNVTRKLSARGIIPDVLVNNAGVTVFKSFRETSVKEFDDILGTNLRGQFLLTKASLPGMIRRRRGVVVNILSMAAKTVYTGSSVYSASKAAGAALMNVVREELREQGIHVVNVYPGAVMTPMWSAAHRRTFDRHMMRPEEIAGLIYEAATAGPRAMVEELVVRPLQGDLKV